MKKFIVIYEDLDNQVKEFLTLGKNEGHAEDSFKSCFKNGETIINCVDVEVLKKLQQAFKVMINEDKDTN